MSSNRPVRSKNPPQKLKEYVTNLPSHSPLASRQQGTHGLAGTAHSQGTNRGRAGRGGGSTAAGFSRGVDIGRIDQKQGKIGTQSSHDIGTPKSRNKDVKDRIVDNYAEIIEVDDSWTPPGEPSTMLMDCMKVCEFPLGTKDSVSVCLSDYKTLQHNTFLNDIIIDFYITYLFHEFLNKEDRPMVYIFTTMFYKRLNSTPLKASLMASYEKDPSLNAEEKRHMRVKGWTKNMNLFEKNMVIIPICEHSHWYLVIAVRPGHIKVGLSDNNNIKIITLLSFHSFLLVQRKGRPREIPF